LFEDFEEINRVCVVGLFARFKKLELLEKEFEDFLPLAYEPAKTRLPRMRIRMRRRGQVL